MVVEVHPDGEAICTEVRLESGALQLVERLFGKCRVFTLERDGHCLIHWPGRGCVGSRVDRLDALCLETRENLREQVLRHREIIRESQSRSLADPFARTSNLLLEREAVGHNPS